MNQIPQASGVNDWSTTMRNIRQRMQDYYEQKHNNFRRIEGLNYTDLDNEAWREETKRKSEVDEVNDDMYLAIMSSAVGIVVGMLTALILWVTEKWYDIKLDWVLDQVSHA